MIIKINSFFDAVGTDCHSPAGFAMTERMTLMRKAQAYNGDGDKAEVYKITKKERIYNFDLDSVRKV